MRPRIPITLAQLGFLVLLLEAMVRTSAPLTAPVALAEGQVFEAGARQGAPIAPDQDLPFEDLSFVPVSIQATHGPTGELATARVDLRDPADPDAQPVSVTLEEPGSIGPMSIAVHDVDLAPVFSVTDLETGSRLFLCVNLAVWSPGAPTDTFTLPNDLGIAKVRFYPDFGSVGASSRPGSLAPADPFVSVQIDVAADHPPLPAHLLGVGESFVHGGHRIELVELRAWADLELSKRSPVNLLTAGLLLLLLGGLLELIRRLSPPLSSDVEA